MAVVMGLDQHRAQIAAEWIDTATGEVSRSRVAPAHREPVRKFLSRFDGQRLEVALEATTGWRFVVEELYRVGAGVHLAEPAETSSLRGRKKHAKTDRADARHLRELLLAGRLPECWIAPDHLLDLRARVRLRHTLIDDRGEWQQRIRAVLYHHGIPRRQDLGLLTAAGREWLERLPLPATAREQVTVGLRMIDALDQQIRAARSAAARLRAPPDGLQGADGPSRDRAADFGRDPRRARRLPTLLFLSPGGPLQRPGHHRVPIRSASRSRPSQPPRPARLALGAI